MTTATEKKHYEPVMHEYAARCAYCGRMFRHCATRVPRRGTRLYCNEECHDMAMQAARKLNVIQSREIRLKKAGKWDEEAAAKLQERLEDAAAYNELLRQDYIKTHPANEKEQSWLELHQPLEQLDLSQKRKSKAAVSRQILRDGKAALPDSVVGWSLGEITMAMARCGYGTDYSGFLNAIEREKLGCELSDHKAVNR